jgi:predicted ATPase/DNA-binding SARP family transcriptional activator
VTGELTRFGVLGPLTCERDDEPLVVPAGHQRTLLALMLQAGGVPLSRDRLIDELWGESPPPTAVSALHVHLSKLRALLGSIVQSGDAGYSLRVDVLALDSWEFDSLLEQARGLEAGDPDRALALINEALALVRGTPLSGVAADGTVGRWRHALEEKQLQARLLRGDLLLELGGGPELVAELEQLVSEHPFEQRSWCQLLVALFRGGRQAEALDAFQRARRLFAVELGLDPGPALTELHQRVLDGDPSLRAASPRAVSARAASWRAQESPGPSRDVPVSALPSPVTGLVGRARELDRLGQLVSDPDVRLITLTGPGGVGKTRLLLELGIAHEQRFADGAAFVELEQISDPGLVATEIAVALGCRPGVERMSPDSLLGYLRERELLLLLDNFEQLLDAGPFVSELLRSAARVTVAVSSRSPLRIRGERLLAVEPLELPSGDGAQDAAGSPAVQLFLERVAAGITDADLGDAAVAPAAAICRALDGLPLAIELAAARVGAIGLEAVAGQLSQPLALGSYALRDLPDRQQTLEAAIDWSFQLLGERARELLLAAAVFNGGFTDDALAAVAEEEIAAPLAELKEANLVRATQQRDRHELLALVRAFAAERLARSGRASELARRHWSYFRALLEPAAKAFDEGVAPGELAAPLLADAANLRIALDRVIAAGDRDSAVVFGLGMRPLWLVGMLRQEAQDAIDRVLALGGVAAADELGMLQAGSFLDGFRAGATVWSQRLADRAQALGDWKSQATALYNLFALATASRDREEMARLRPAIETLLEPGGGQPPSAWSFYTLALDAYVSGNFAKARDYGERGFEHALGHDYAEATLSSCLLLAASAADEVIEQQRLLEALRLIERSQVQPLMVFGLWFAARYAAGVDDLGAAAGMLARAEAIRAALSLDLWPEEVLRDETLAVLREGGVDWSGGLAEAVAVPEALAAPEALAEAISWVSSRPTDEVAVREGAARFVLEG